jgi:class 3 adenylate cyclase
MSTEKFRRKLTAILSAHVEGYSLLMRDDEEATIQTLTTYRNVITQFIQQYRGRLVDATGDNLLAEFPSAVDSVNCAVEIQRELFEQNAKLTENRRMRFRMGVNLGDVVVKEESIYGDGVNIAARMGSLACGGGICISGTIYDQVKYKLDLKYDYLGEQKVKNIKEPVRAYWISSLPGAASHRAIKAKKAVNKTWRNVIVAASAVLIIGAASAIWNFYFQPKIPVDTTPGISDISDLSDKSGKLGALASEQKRIEEEKRALGAKKREEENLKIEMEKQKIAAERKRIEDDKRVLGAKQREEENLKMVIEKEKIAAERKRFEEEKRVLEAKKRQEEKLKIEMEKQRIAAERNRMEEEKRALESKKRREEARIKQLAYISNTASKSRDNGIVYHKPEGDSRHSLAVFPFCESAIANSKVKEQKKFTDFMIKYTSNIPNIVFTHSFYPYHEHRTDHQLRLVNSLIHEGLERDIWYGDSTFPRKKPDYNVLEKLAKKINSDLILTFKISSTMTHPSEIRVTFNGYLVDIEKNIYYEKIERKYYTERSIGFADFDIIKKMTKDLFELYQKSNPQSSR